MLNRTRMESDLVHAKVLKRVIVLLAEERGRTLTKRLMLPMSILFILISYLRLERIRDVHNNVKGRNKRV